MGVVQQRVLVDAQHLVFGPPGDFERRGVGECGAALDIEPKNAFAGGREY